MSTFQAKRPASADKIRGGYYTPQAIADFVASWVAAAGPRLLEPSCGDGAILSRLARHSSAVQGVELLESEAHAASKYAPVEATDFFAWFGDDAFGTWDGVAGNPPYIRFGNWPPDQRQPALDLMTRSGLNPSKLTNAWVPFVLASVLATRPGGRIGLVLPAELLQVTYAAQLRDYLVTHLSDLTLVTFRKLVFDGILQEVIILLGVRGFGPAAIRTIQASDENSLATLDLQTPAAPALEHDREKWTKYFLNLEQVEALRRTRTSMGLSPLGMWASVDVGIVTGRNSFFTFTDEEVQRNGLRRHCISLVSRSTQLTSITYDTEDLAAQREQGQRTWLLNADTRSNEAALQAHVIAGESAGVHLGYKCSIRRPWWRTPSVWIPDAFMLRQIHLTPRMTANQTSATSTDTIHRVRVGIGVDSAALATAFHNSATFAFCEAMGRSYGGGILELEPGEAELLPIPAPGLVEPGLIADVDEVLRSGEADKARDLVDNSILIGKLGWTEKDVSLCSSAYVQLRDRRTARGSRSARA